MNLSSTGLVEILNSACRIKARFLRATEEQTQTGIFGKFQLDHLIYFCTWQSIGVVSFARWQFIPFTFCAWIWPASWKKEDILPTHTNNTNLLHIPHCLGLRLFLHLNQFDRGLNSQICLLIKSCNHSNKMFIFSLNIKAFCYLWILYQRLIKFPVYLFHCWNDFCAHFFGNNHPLCGNLMFTS